MPTGRHLSQRNKTLVIIVAIIAIILGAMVALGFFDQKSEPALTGENRVPAPGTALIEPEPTDTVKTGVIGAETTGAQDNLYLTVDGTRIPLVLDEQSYCNMGSGGLPCMAMSIQFSTAFGGKHAVIDGNMQGNSLLARRLRILEENETPRVTAGSVYIPWVRAHDMILACEVKSLLQTHEGIVRLTTKTGKEYVAVEPVIDEVFKSANEATAACGSIGLGTE